MKYPDGDDETAISLRDANGNKVGEATFII